MALTSKRRTRGFPCARFRLSFALLAVLAAAAAAAASVRGQDPAATGHQPFELRTARAEDVAFELQQALQGKVQVLIDRQGNRVLVHGSQQYVQIAEHLIRQLDGAVGSNVSRSYAVRPESIERVANQLRNRFAAARNVRISVDSLASQIDVAAPVEGHREVAALLDGLGSRTDERKPGELSDSSSAVLRTYELRNMPADVVLDKLKRTWGSAVQIQALGRGDDVRIQLRSERVPRTIVEFDRKRNLVRLEGPAQNVKSWQLLLDSLDDPEAFRQGQASFVRARQSDSEAIQKAVSLMQAMAKQDRTNTTPETLEIIAKKGKPGWGGRLVSRIFQRQVDAAEAADEGAGDGTDEGAAGDADNQAAGQGGGGGLLGTVRVEFLEGLDIMIIRGHPEDVATVTKLIAQIQNDAIGTQPDVQIVPLRHVSSRAIYGVLNDLYQQVYAPRQGPVSITPLIKPNALLLVGRPENNQSVVSLLRQLDVAVPAATQIEVFQLKYMSALDAARRIDDFYNTAAPSPNPQDPSELVRGLATRVRVTADFRSNAIIVQAGPRDMEEVTTFIRKIDVVENKSLHEVKIIPLRHALAADLAPVLQDAINGQLPGAGRAGSGQNPLPQSPVQQQAIPSQVRSAILELITVDRNGGESRLRSGIVFDVRVIPDASRNALIIIGPAKSMPLLEALVAELDQLPSANAQIKVFTIVNGDATNLAVMLQQLFGQQVTAGQGGFGQAAFLRALSPATAGGSEGSLVPIRFAIDQRTNSIVTSGSESDLNVVEAILARLDEDGIESRKNTVYRLQNAPALDVATAITDVLSRQQQASLAALTGVLSPAEQFEREVFIVPEPVSNSLIISSTPRYFDNVVQIIKDLDQRPPLVMIQVVIAEVNYGDEFQLGAEFGFQDSLLFDRGIAGGMDAAQPLIGFPFNQGLLGNDNTPASLATRENLAGQALSNLAVGRVDANLGFGGLVLSAGNESVNMLLRALQNNTSAQILARPQIMTLDNQTAFVQIGAIVSRVNGSTTTPQGGTTQAVTDVDVGIILRVQPRISPDGTVVMLVDTQRSEVSATDGVVIGSDINGTPIFSPNINTVTAQTTLSARSGQTVVFAGLMQKDKAYERRSVPWLGTLPGIGWLFRYDREEERRRELLIVMTPYVVKDDEDYEWINRMEMDRMSWCLSDVVQMHGNLGAASPAIWNNSAPSIIYPALDPTGTQNLRPIPQETLDTPTPLPQTSSRRQKPTVLDQAKAVFNWPRDAGGAKGNPLHQQHAAPERGTPYWQEQRAAAAPVRFIQPAERPRPISRVDNTNYDAVIEAGPPRSTARNTSMSATPYPNRRTQYSSEPNRSTHARPLTTDRSPEYPRQPPNRLPQPYGPVRPIPAAQPYENGAAFIPSY